MIAPVLLMGRRLLPLSGLADNNPASCREKNTPTPQVGHKQNTDGESIPGTHQLFFINFTDKISVSQFKNR
jgi:hypothetical protein